MNAALSRISYKTSLLTPRVPRLFLKRLQGSPPIGHFSFPSLNTRSLSDSLTVYHVVLNVTARTTAPGK